MQNNFLPCYSCHKVYDQIFIYDRLGLESRLKSASTPQISIHWCHYLKSWSDLFDLVLIKNVLSEKNCFIPFSTGPYIKLHSALSAILDFQSRQKLNVLYSKWHKNKTSCNWTSNEISSFAMFKLWRKVFKNKRFSLMVLC
jgi:hypothetical protein